MSRKTVSGGPRSMRTIILIAIALVVVALLLRPRRPVPGTSPPAMAKDDRVILDNLKAADARKDWVTTLYWAERLGARHPRDSGVLLARGTAWNNYAVAQRPSLALERPALRTSLERMECMRRALVLTDSAGMAAQTPLQWADANKRLAEHDGTLGLTGDELLAYETIKQRQPDDMDAAMRAYFMRAIFYDPVHPDTSEWDRYMRQQGRR
jgi:hypothetical protein